MGYGSTHVRDMTIEKLDQIHYHEEFNPTTGEFDVGLIKITGAFNSPFDPIKINMDILAFGSKVTVSGFGRMEVKIKVSSIVFERKSIPFVCPARWSWICLSEIH